MPPPPELLGSEVVVRRLLSLKEVRGDRPLPSPVVSRPEGDIWDTRSAVGTAEVPFVAV
jgi:hypothetical protein